MKNCGKFIRRKSIRSFVSYFFPRPHSPMREGNLRKQFEKFRDSATVHPFHFFFRDFFRRFDVSCSKANFRWFFNMNFRSGNRQLTLLITGVHFSQDRRLLSTFFYHIILYSSPITAGMEQSFWQFRNNADAAQFSMQSRALSFYNEGCHRIGIGKKNFEMLRKNIARLVLYLPEKQFESYLLLGSLKNFQHQFN